jgi:hypothetical protein
VGVYIKWYFRRRGKNHGTKIPLVTVTSLLYNPSLKFFNADFSSTHMWRIITSRSRVTLKSHSKKC